MFADEGQEAVPEGGEVFVTGEGVGVARGAPVAHRLERSRPEGLVREDGGGHGSIVSGGVSRVLAVVEDRRLAGDLRLTGRGLGPAGFEPHEALVEAGRER